MIRDTVTKLHYHIIIRKLIGLRIVYIYTGIELVEMRTLVDYWPNRIFLTIAQIFVFTQCIERS